MRLFLALAAAATSAAAFGAEQQPYPLLIFEFPDGVRGGRGAISGSGPFVGSDPLPLQQKCGLHRPQSFDQVSHRYFVYGQRSGRDQKIVACFVKTNSRHFNVGYGKIGESITSPMIFDKKPFEKFAGKTE